MNPPHAKPQQPPANDESWHAEERINWARQLRPQWALVWISFAAVIAAAITLWIVNSTLGATKQAASAATRQSQIADEDMKRSHRPWAFIDGDLVVTKPLSFNPDKTIASTSFSYYIKNSGSSPAINATTQTNLRIGRDINALIAMSRDVPACDRYFVEQSTKIVGLFVPPSERRPVPEGEASTRQFPQTGPVSVFVETCVGYRDEFGIPHGTGVSWQYVPPGEKDSVIKNLDSVVPGSWKIFGIYGVAY